MVDMSVYDDQWSHRRAIHPHWPEPRWSSPTDWDSAPDKRRADEKP